MPTEKPAPTDGRSLSGAAVGVLLGSGLGEVSSGFPVAASLAFADVPGLSDAAVTGHRGRVTLAMVGNKRCLFVEGRKHYYEGNGAQIRALMTFVAGTGIREMIVTSAGGSLDPGLPPGQLVVVSDILDLQMRAPYAPLRPLPAGLGRGRVPAGEARDHGMRARLETAARAAGITLGRGAMACNAGPAYETPAEIVALRRAGASVVTMSGAPEIAILRELGIAVACVVVVTNWASGISTERLSHDEVLAAGAPAAGPLRQLVHLFVDKATS